MDAVQKANSGHPGMPMGMADVAPILIKYFLKYNTDSRIWYSWRSNGNNYRSFLD